MAEVSFFTAFKFWLKLGCLSFGGPAGQIGAALIIWLASLLCFL